MFQSQFWEFSAETRVLESSRYLSPNERSTALGCLQQERLCSNLKTYWMSVSFSLSRRILAKNLFKTSKAILGFTLAKESP